MRILVTFHFNKYDEALNVKQVESWGGHLGMALNRAWKKINTDEVYCHLKPLRPTKIEITYSKKVRIGKSLVERL